MALAGAAVAAYERKYGSQHPAVAVPLTQLGELHLAAGRPAEARASFERALEVAQPVVGTDHGPLATVLLGLGSALVAEGDLGRARPVLERALRLWGDEAIDPYLRGQLALSLARALESGVGADEQRAIARREFERAEGKAAVRELAALDL